MEQQSTMNPVDEERSALRRAATASFIGNFVEWFDWFVYAAFALYFSRAFFPDDDQTTQLLNSAMVFGGGFLAGLINRA